MSSPNASRLEQRFARVHPVGVAAHRVDLAVVRDVAIRMRAIPARERVGAEARVHQRERRLHQRIAADPGSTARAARSAACLCRRASCATGWRCTRTPRLPASTCGSRCKRACGSRTACARTPAHPADRRIATDEHLPHERLARLRGVAEHRVVASARCASRARVWPSDCTICSKRSSMRRRSVGLRGRNTMPQPYAPGSGSSMRAFLHASTRNRCGICTSTPAPSPLSCLGAAGAAMIEVARGPAGPAAGSVRLAALDVDDEADAAGVVLERRIVQTLLGRQTRPARTAPLGAAHVSPSSVFNPNVDFTASVRSAYTAPGSGKVVDSAGLSGATARGGCALQGALRRRPVEYNPEDRSHITEVDTCVNALPSPRS